MDIAVIEDNNKYRNCIVQGLQLFPDCNIIHSLHNALNIEKNFDYKLPHIVLLDINMPGINGLEAIDRKSVV